MGDGWMLAKTRETEMNLELDGNFSNLHEPSPFGTCASPVCVTSGCYLPIVVSDFGSVPKPTGGDAFSSGAFGLFLGKNTKSAPLSLLAEGAHDVNQRREVYEPDSAKGGRGRSALSPCSVRRSIRFMFLDPG